MASADYWMGDFVYVIGHDTGPQKVGFSYNPEKRARVLKVAGEPHYKVHYAHPVESDVVREIEALAHWLLDEHALGRERFDVTPDVAAQAVKDAVAWHAAGQRAPGRDPATLCNVYKTVSLPPEAWAFVEKWRRSQQGPVMSLSKAVRTIVDGQLDREAARDSA